VGIRLGSGKRWGMIIRDIMTTNVVTIPSSTSLADARRIIDAHRIRRLPVVDKGKLVGVVSRDTLDRSGPSKLTTFSMHELSYLLSKVSVKDVMKRDVVTVPPDATVEEAVTMAQSRKVGALIVVEDGRVVGIATTNDIFYKIVNPMLGIDQPGIRFSVRKWRDIADLQKILAVMAQFSPEISTIYAVKSPETGENDLIAHLTVGDSAGLIEAVRKAGFEVRPRAR
jgi:acetoin utilization protein AcuB